MIRVDHIDLQRNTVTEAFAVICTASAIHRRFHINQQNELMDMIPSLLAVFVAALVAWIGYQQYILAKERFKLDLFDKRFAVFKATQTFLLAIEIEAKFKLEEFSNYKVHTQDAAFLFGPEIDHHLHKLTGTALEMRKIQGQIDLLPQGTDRSGLCERDTKLLNELAGEAARLMNVFAPYLSFAKWK